MSRKVKKTRMQEIGGNAMVYLIIAAATLTIAGVAELVAMVIALYTVSVVLDVVRRDTGQRGKGKDE